MNERLTVLYEEAITEVWESRKGPDGLVRTDGNPYIFYEKFAELIVRDCADMVKDAHKSGGGTYLHVLYERYGIEYPWVK
jgi:hypothetical protein